MQTKQNLATKEKIESTNTATNNYQAKVREQMDSLHDLRNHIDFELKRLKTINDALTVLVDAQSSRTLDATVDTLGKKGGVESFTPSLTEQDLTGKQGSAPSQTETRQQPATRAANNISAA